MAKAEQAIAVMQSQYETIIGAVATDHTTVIKEVARMNGDILKLKVFSAQARAIIAFLAFMIGSGFGGAAVVAYFL